MAGLIHEVNNPLGVVLGFAQEMVSADAPPPTWTDDLETIVEHSKRIAALMTTWRLVLKRDATGLSDDLRRSGSRVWRIVAFSVRARFQIGGLPDDPDAEFVGDSWVVEWPAETQIMMWMLVFRWLFEQISSPPAVALTVGFVPNRLMLAPSDTGAAVAFALDPETTAARECRKALTALLAPFGARFTVAPALIAIETAT